MARTAGQIVAAAVNRGAITERRAAELLAAGGDLAWVDGLAGLRDGTTPDPAQAARLARGMAAAAGGDTPEYDRLYGSGREPPAAASARAAEAARMSDSQLYDLLYPSPEEQARRLDAVNAAASSTTTPLTDDEFRQLFPQPQDEPHDALTTPVHIHNHDDGNGGIHRHPHGHNVDDNHDHHAVQSES